MLSYCCYKFSIYLGLISNLPLIGTSTKLYYTMTFPEHAVCLLVSCVLLKFPLSRLSSRVSSLFSRIRRTLKYYSTWNHLKELFLVPYRRRPKDSAKITLRRSGSKTEVVIDTKSHSGKAGGGSSLGGTNTKGRTIRTDGEQLTSSQKLKSGAKKLKEIPPTSRAKEVEDYLFQEVYFTHSKEPRMVRPRGLAFHVGQVVRHKQDNYHGVVVGWDPVAKVTNTCVEFIRVISEHE